jgi:serine/threonine protein phosphatase PrpC
VIVASLRLSPPLANAMPPVHATVRSFAKTHVGRHRKGNEDAYFRDDGIKLYVVADGMGGHAAGEVASTEAVDTIHGMVKRGVQHPGADPLDVPRAQRLLEGAIQAATYMLVAIAEFERDKSGMGTTISAALMVNDSLVIGQVGDSRIYQIRDFSAEQITEDHTLIAWQIKQGIISSDEAKVSPHRNVITRAVGNREYVEVDTLVVPTQPGDRYLLCSDGLHGYFEDPDEIALIAELGGDAAVTRFIDLANERGGRDNITAVLVEVT